MAEPGAVSWQFERRGVVIVPRTAPEDEVLAAVLDAGAEDLRDEGDTWRVTCEPSALGGVRGALEASGIAYDAAEVTMLATNTVPLESPEDARRVLGLVDALDEHDDVQGVYANFDVPDSVLQAVAG
jgi:transcriptional/translational regulatory protein YebC/TACO1